MAMDEQNTETPQRPLTTMLELSTDEIVVYSKDNEHAWVQGIPVDVDQ